MTSTSTKRRVGMPSQSGDQGRGHPLLFGFTPAFIFEDMPDGGGYPKGFLPRAYESLGVTDPESVLHLCSGSMRVGVRVDIRPEMNPTIVADCRNVPLPDESFDWIMADPPYSEEYARNLYGTGDDYPKPGQILKEASRLLRPGGRVGLLHFQVPMSRPPLRLIGVWGVTTGAGYAIRAWSVFEKAGVRGNVLIADQGKARMTHTCEGDNCIGCPICARAGKYETCGYVCGHDNGEGE